MFDGYLLSVLIWLPILGGVVTLFSGDNLGARPVALLVSAVTFFISLLLWLGFNPEGYQMQFVEFAPWIESFKINYHLGVDGISMPLILLNTLTTVLIVIAGWEVIKHKPAQYMAAFLMMEGVINGVFAAQDSILFYVFFEVLVNKYT